MRSSKSKKLVGHMLGIAVILAAITIFLEQKPSQPEVCFDHHCIQVSIADTPETRQQGLMFVKSMAEQSGMLFVFDKVGFYPFWMKNTLIPLDMIRVNDNNQIVEMQTATPCITANCRTYGGNQPASYVIEINAGLAQTRGLQAGQTISINK